MLKVFNSYPDDAKEKLLFLRQLILDTAKENRNIDELEETLKWGQPSYISPIGSAIRIDWIKKTPNQYAIYFNCKTKLVDTFKELYPSQFVFSGNRALIFDLDDELPLKELTHCIYLALNYHKLKKLPLLGA